MSPSMPAASPIWRRCWRGLAALAPGAMVDQSRDPARAGRTARALRSLGHAAALLLLAILVVVVIVVTR